MPYGLGQVVGGKGVLGWGDGDHARISLIISQPSLRRKQIKYTTEGILPFNTDPGINRAAPLESWFPPHPPPSWSPGHLAWQGVFEEARRETVFRAGLRQQEYTAQSREVPPPSVV